MAMMLGAGCASSPGSRIAKNRHVFESYPAEVRTAIEQGRVEIGFTSEQARLALGGPDRVVTRTAESGASEVWVYDEKRSRLGLGIGVGMGSGPVGGGVGVGTGGSHNEDERMRITFVAGRVSAVEQSTP